MISVRNRDTNPSNQDKSVLFFFSLSYSRFLEIIQVCYSALFRESTSFFHANFPHSQDYLMAQDDSWSSSLYICLPISREKEGKKMS